MNASRLIRLVAKPQGTHPLYQQVLFKSEEGTLRIQATNGTTDLEIRVPNPNRFEAAAPARLFEVLQKSLETLTYDEGHLIGGEGRYRVQATAPETWPPFALPEKKLATLPLHKLRKLRHVRYAAAHDEYRAIFRGVQFEAREGHLRFVATDGFRLALAETEAETTEELRFVVPANAVDLILEGTRHLGEDAEVTLFLHEENHRLGVQAGNLSVATGLLQGTFPDYEQVIPDEFVARASFPKITLKAALQEALPFVSGNHRVDLCLDEGVLAAENDYGNARIPLNFELEGEALCPAFNAQHLLDAIAHLPDENLELALTGPQTPARLTPKGRTDALAVVVPLRVN